MNDDFIIAGMNESKSKEIADILSNKTARRIIEHLSDNNGSETDVANALNIPLSTVHYNVQKLLKNRIIEVKEFFWSEKGNKINIYKVARRPIIIAPKYSRVSQTLKSIIPAVIAASIFLFAVFAILYNTNNNHGINNGNGTIVNLPSQTGVKQFSSFDELKTFLKNNAESQNDGRGMMETAQSFGAAPMAAKSADIGTTGANAGGSVASGPSAEEYSTTNIQVQGVDEADIVKNDGKYIYTVIGSKIAIVDAYPPENAKLVSEINMSGNIQEIFVNKDKLIVFGQEQANYYYGAEEKMIGGIMPYRPTYYMPESFVRIYDISDRSNPVFEKNITSNGNYINSRMIGDYVYFIVNQPIYDFNNVVPPIMVDGGIVREAKISDIYYFDVPDESYMFSTVFALNLDNSEVSSKTFMIGYTQNLYVSTDNIYITYMKRISNRYYYEKMIDDVYLPLLPDDAAGHYSSAKEARDSNSTYYEKLDKIGVIMQDYAETLDADARLKFQNDFQDSMNKFQQEIDKETQKTVIHKIAVNKNEISHAAQGEVPGNVLNQFSMDEYQGTFRIATTTGEVWSGNSKNHLYILDSSLNIIGKVEDLAQGERIYSARFIGDRAYIVTFKKIDPLFVIDTSDPANPQVLGYLKITGFSDYLHPYDETHIIGIGKETAGGDERFSWYQGIKVSLFDVTDVQNPKEVGKIELGDRGTDSYALQDHKAFLFDKKKGIIVIPVMLAEINKSQYSQYGENLPDWAYGNPVWQGAYILHINLDEITIRGRITHFDNTTDSWGFYDDRYTVKRSLYMGNTLYTISNSMIKANSLDDISETNKIKLPYETYNYPYPMYERGI